MVLKLLVLFLATWATVVSAGEDFDVDKTLSVLEEGDTFLSQWEHTNKGIFILGITGSGKSTLVQFLSKDSNALSAIKDGREIVISDGNNKISNDSFLSRTSFPEKVYDPTSKVDMIDCPGFSDTKSKNDPTFDIATNYLIKKALDRTTNIKFVLTVIHSSVVLGNERHGFMNLLRYAGSLIRDVKKYKDSISLVITKVPNDEYITDDEEKQYAVQFMEEAKNYIQSDWYSEDGSEEVDDTQLLDNMKLLIDIFTQNSKGKYNNIGLFHRPDKPAISISTSKLLQETKQNIRRIIFDNSKFTTTNSNDFLYFMSENSKLKLNQEVLPTIIKRIDSIVSKTSSDISKTYLQTISVENFGNNQISKLIELRSSLAIIINSDQFSDHETLVKVVKQLKTIIPKNADAVIQSILNLLEQLKFVLAIYATPINYYNQLGFNKFDKVDHDLTHFFEFDFVPQMKNKTMEAIVLCTDRIKSQLLKEYLNADSLEQAIEFLKQKYFVYNALIQQQETTDDLLRIFKFLGQQNENCVTLNEFSEIFNKYEKVIGNSNINYKSYGIFDISSVPIYIENLFNTDANSRVKIIVETVTSNTKTYLIQTITKNFQSSKDINVLFSFAQSEKNYLDNLLSVKNFTQTTLIDVFKVLKTKIEKINLISEINYSLKVLELYNSFGEPINFEIVLASLHEITQEIKRSTDNYLVPLINEQVAQVINNCAIELTQIIRGNSEKLGVSQLLDEYIQTESNYYGNIISDIISPEKFISLITRILNILKSKENKYAILNIVDFLKKNKFFEDYKKINRDMYTNFGLDRLANIRDVTYEISSWLGVVKSYRERVSRFGNVGTLQNHEIINTQNIRKFISKSELLDANVPDFIISALNNIVADSKYNFNFNRDILTISGSYLTAQIISDIVRTSRNIKTLNIQAFDTVYLDSNLSFQDEIEVTLVAPLWHVFGERKISLLGAQGKSCNPPQNENLSPKKGVMGLPGNPGNPGGSFYGIGLEFEGADGLKVISKGGKGGPGQQGGKGGDRVVSSHNMLPSCNDKQIIKNLDIARDIQEFDYTTVRNCNQLKQFSVDPSVCESIKRRDFVFFTLKVGEEGFEGGDGGSGGLGGKPGCINMKSLNSNGKYFTERVEGEQGIAGLGGVGGRSNLNSKVVLLEHKLHSKNLISFQKIPNNSSWYYWKLLGEAVPDEQNFEGKSGRPGINADQIQKSKSSRIPCNSSQHQLGIYQSFKKNLFSQKSLTKSSKPFLINFYKSLELNSFETAQEITDIYSRNFKDFSMLIKNLLDLIEKDKFNSKSNNILLSYVYRNSMRVNMITKVGSYTDRKTSLLNEKQNLVKFNLNININMMKTKFWETKSFVTKEIEKIRTMLEKKIVNNAGTVKKLLDEKITGADLEQSIINEVSLTIMNELVEGFDIISKLISPIFEKLSEQPLQIEKYPSFSPYLESIRKGEAAKVISVIEIILNKLLPYKNEMRQCFSQVDSIKEQVTSEQIRIDDVIDHLNKTIQRQCDGLQVNVLKEFDSVMTLAQISFNYAAIHGKHPQNLEILKNSVMQSNETIRTAIMLKSILSSSLHDCLVNVHRIFKGNTVDFDVYQLISDVYAFTSKIKTVLQGVHYQFSIENTKLTDYLKIISRIMNDMYQHFHVIQLSQQFEKILSFQESGDIDLNILQNEINMIVNGLQQRIFPFGYLLNTVDLQKNSNRNYNQLVTETLFKIDEVTSNFKNIKIQDKHRDELISHDFNPTDPMYSWSKLKFKLKIANLMRGEEISIAASVYDMFALSALKFNEIKLYLQTDEQGRLDKLMEQFSVRLVHTGSSYFKCDNKFFLMHSNLETIEDNRNLGDFLLSPYTVWKMKLVPKNGNDFKILNEFMDKVDLLLVGRGQYLTTNSNICYSDLENIYHRIDPFQVNAERDKIIEDHLHQIIR